MGFIWTKRLLVPQKNRHFCAENPIFLNETSTFGQMNHAVTMPIFLHCAALYQNLCRCPCCTFWGLGDKNPILAITSALVAEHICSCLQCPFTPIGIQLYGLGQLCTKNSLWWPAWAHGYCSCPRPCCQVNSVKLNKPVWVEYLLTGWSYIIYSIEEYEKLKVKVLRKNRKENSVKK